MAEPKKPNPKKDFRKPGIKPPCQQNHLERKERKEPKPVATDCKTGFDLEQKTIQKFNQRINLRMIISDCSNLQKHTIKIQLNHRISYTPPRVELGFTVSLY